MKINPSNTPPRITSAILDQSIFLYISECCNKEIKVNNIICVFIG